MNGAFEQVSAMILPISTTLLLLIGIITIFFGIYKINKKDRRDGLRYIATGTGILDCSIVVGLLFVLGDNTLNFIEPNTKINLLFQIG